MPEKDRRTRTTPWLTTWRRLLPETTFATLDDLGAFLNELGLHNGDIPTAEAFRLGIAKFQRGKYYWHHPRCTRLLRAHHKMIDRPKEPRKR